MIGVRPPGWGLALLFLCVSVVCLCGVVALFCLLVYCCASCCLFCVLCALICGCAFVRMFCDCFWLVSRLLVAGRRSVLGLGSGLRMREASQGGRKEQRCKWYYYRALDRMGTSPWASHGDVVVWGI